MGVSGLAAGTAVVQFAVPAIARRNPYCSKHIHHSIRASAANQARCWQRSPLRHSDAAPRGRPFHQVRIGLMSGAGAVPQTVPCSRGHATQSAEDTLVQYVVLRRDLWRDQGWPLGSIIAQGCHASTAALWESRDSPHTLEYCSPGKLGSMTKVVLEVKGEPQLRTLAGKLQEAGVHHHLWIEQPEGYATCLATHPHPRSEIVQYFKKLNLCKGTP
mmetsp:Transcript_14624/g.44186  ORF Transcript_14624/g.44186 Transcript_14624/m.44186 type:complete len:216 (-) Transcript_14624:435-1082(-)